MKLQRTPLSATVYIQIEEIMFNLPGLQKDRDRNRERERIFSKSQEGFEVHRFSKTVRTMTSSFKTFKKVVSGRHLNSNMWNNEEQWMLSQVKCLEKSQKYEQDGTPKMTMIQFSASLIGFKLNIQHDFTEKNL